MRREQREAWLWGECYRECHPETAHGKSWQRLERPISTFLSSQLNHAGAWKGLFILIYEEQETLRTMKR
jgi:hypothetical protein